MNKTERNKLINKQVYRLVEGWGYDIDFTDTDPMFLSPDGDYNDDIQYRRSNHTLAALSWASPETLINATLIEKYIKELKAMSDEQLLVEHQGA